MYAQEVSSICLCACRYVPPADEEVAAVRQVGLLEDMERFAARLVHLAPTSDVGQVRTPP